MRIRRLILFLALVNSTLYAALLPLWEGFDEAFHYSYVETLWQTLRFPVLGETMLSADVSKSFLFAPASHVVHRQIQATTTYENWFLLPQAEKERRRLALTRLRADAQPGAGLNYEAQHAPLAYISLALLDWPMSSAAVTLRVLILRIVAGIAAILLLYAGTTSLCRTLELPEPFANAALLAMFCSQMLYATVSHVGNDWLAVGVSAMFFATVARLFRWPCRRAALSVALWLTAGLLTKAYFLAFAFLAVGTLTVLIAQRRAHLRTMMVATIPLALAVPWYIRNRLLYGNLSGMQEQLHGIGFAQIITAARHLDWVSSTGFLARGSLWTGNDSFTSFSRGTLDTVLLLLLIAMVSWGLHTKLIRAPERTAFGGIVLFSLALAYDTCVSFAATGGVSAGASPWYAQVLLMPVFVLACLGASRWRRFGPALWASLTVLLSWVLIATWTIKLFPMYSGAGMAPMHARDIWNWYSRLVWTHAPDLSLLALAPARWLYSVLVMSLILHLGIGFRVIAKLIRQS